jgi:4-alpha-glucanotransferase
MKIIFNINYHTNWGESLYLVGDVKLLGNGSEQDAVKMNLDSDDNWSYSISLPDDSGDFAYHYLVKNDNGFVKHEWGKPHAFICGDKITSYTIHDHWQEQTENKPFFSSAFTEGIFSRKKDGAVAKPKAGSLTLRVFAPVVKDDEVLGVCGSLDSLGNWDPKEAIALSDANFPEWSVTIDIHNVNRPFEYKFLILKKSNKELVAWDEQNNHYFGDAPVNKKDCVVISGLNFVNQFAPWKGAGTAIPVFSLRSADDFGVGDFYDLFKMIDWTEATGQKILQLLPINDTTMTHTWTDSYPYNANSTFALHPMYIRLSAVGEISDKALKKHYSDIAAELNALPEIDYEKVNEVKTEYLKKIFAENGAKTLKLPQFKSFVKNNGYWLTPYAVFCTLRDINKTADFNKWGKYSKFDAKLIDEFCKDHIAEIDFIYFTQYNLDKQLREIRNYAHKHGVVLKGDIPIGISRTSVDAWVNPDLFNMDCQAGAPPDDFSVMGQNWGFPTYNWEEMNKDGFQWWKNRFKKMAEYFDAYRIDHILGFFRIWEIPMDAVHGLLGYFNPALPYSSDELRTNYDFWLDKDLYTTPYIMDYFLYDFFGEYLDEAVKTFLTDKGYGRHGLKEFVNTQKKVVDYFAGKEKSDKNEKLKNALLGLIDEVLFIEDPNQKNMYHPRISAQFTYVYRSLTYYERWCYDRLYTDFFYHRHNDFWYGKAMWKLPPLINATDMLVCGEDLGMIPDCVSAVMNSQHILSLEIQRMPKDPKAEFGDTYNYPFLSVCTTSTHDMSGIRAWWEDDREKTQHYFNNVLHEGGAAPFFAEPWICDRIVSMHLQSPSILAILPLQDWLSINGELRRKDPREEQINIPAESKHYWRYRMHLSLEDLLSQTEFNNYLKEKIESCGR